MSRNDYHCQICGVSFHIRRIRVKDEPRSAALTRSGHWVNGRDFSDDEDSQGNADDDSYEGSRVSLEQQECSSETGCCMVYRKSYTRHALRPEPLLYEDDLENIVHKADPDFEYRSASDDESLEYATDASSSSIAGDRSPSLGDAPSPDEWTFKISGPPHPDYDTEFESLSTRLGVPQFFKIAPDRWGAHPEGQHKADCYEHIAGPDCRSQSGFLGMHISPEEMRGCYTVQCIFPKPHGWEPQEDDLIFELQSKHQLTGLATMADELKVLPIRHGIDRIKASEVDKNIPMSQQDLKNIGLPFHPSCFELFIQASQQYIGHVDIDALMDIRDRTWLERRDFPRHHQHVADGKAQYWKHNVGHEYLAANPVFIPNLQPILKSAICNEPEFSVDNSTVNSNYSAHTASLDPFSVFPADILLLVVDYLAAADVAALQQSSYSFSRLPVSVWYSIVKREMPWLYEAWSPNSQPYYWATIVHRDLVDEQKALEEFNRDFEDQCKVIQQEMPDIYGEWVKDRLVWEWPMHPETQEMASLSPMALPYERTNWYRLYWDITDNWKHLKGLQNRARIWDAVVQIVDEIKAKVEKERDEDGLGALF